MQIQTLGKNKNILKPEVADFELAIWTELKNKHRNVPTEDLCGDFLLDNTVQISL